MEKRMKKLIVFLAILALAGSAGATVTQFTVSFTGATGCSVTPSDTTVDSNSTIAARPWVASAGYSIGSGFVITRSNTNVTMSDSTSKTCTFTVKGNCTITGTPSIRPRWMKLTCCPTCNCPAGTYTIEVKNE